MLSLVSVNDLIQVITGAAVNAIWAVAEFGDYSTVASSPFFQDTHITTATTTTIVNSPNAAQITRVVKELGVFNSSSLSCFIEIQLVNNAPSIVPLFSYTLLAGEQIVYGEGEFIVVSATGLIKKHQALGL